MFRHAALLLVALVPFSSATDKYTKTATQSWDFEQGGKIELHVRYGDVRIVPSNDSRISLSYTMHSQHASFMNKVEPDFHLLGSNATLALHAPHDGSIDVELRVPFRSDLFVRVSAGDVSVGPIEGSHDVETHAGDIAIGLLADQHYGPVDASTHAGDVSAPFGEARGWIGNSLKYYGPGKFRIHAHTFAGDIDLKPTETARVEDQSQHEE